MTQSNTGMSDVQYDLVSVLYHALSAGQTHSKYIQDAQKAGNQELAQFFQQVQQEDNARAQKAMQMLSKMGGQS